MTTRINPPSAVVDTVPPSGRHGVVVDGRVIPRLECRPKGGEVEFILDGRFSYTVPAEWSKLFAGAIADALAIGAGYSHAGASERGGPFAPQLMIMEDPHA